MEGASMEDRLDAIFRVLEDSLVGGRVPPIPACKKELEQCMADMRELMIEPMHTDKAWVEGLSGIREQLNLLAQLLDRFMDNGGAHFAQLMALRSTVEVMADRITSLENERERVKKARRKEQALRRQRGESSRQRRATYERELYMYSLVDSPERWKSKKEANSKSARITKAVLALLPPPEKTQEEQALALAAAQPELAPELQKTPLAKMQEKEQLALELRMGGCVDEELEVRRELIGLARLHCQFDDGDIDATALARAHVNLGGAYANKAYWKQAALHGKRALDHLEKLPLSTPGFVDVQRSAHALIGEALMNTDKPKPELAIEHLSKGYPEEAGSDMPPVAALKMGECYAQMGEDSGEKALEAARNARKLVAELRTLDRRLRSLDQADIRRLELQDRLYKIRPQVAAIERELPGDCKTAESHLDKAIDCIMDYIDRFERGLEKQGLEPDRHSPELKTQYRRCSELLLLLAEVKQAPSVFSQASTAAKAYSESMGLLEEITRLQRVYGNLGSDLLASTHILRGNTLFKINRLDEALEAFQELLCLQQSRGGETEAQAKAEAEAHKLLGNVYVALQDNRSAEQHFTDALHLYAEAGGSSGKAAADMQHRIDRLAAYTKTLSVER